MLVQEVLSAIEDYQNRDSDQRQKKRLAAQMSYRQELIIPKRVNSRQTNIRRRSLQPGSRNKSRRIRFNFLKEENLKYVNVLTLPMCNERSANYAKIYRGSCPSCGSSLQRMSIPHAIKYLEKFEKTEFSERNVFIYSVNNGIYTEVGQCPSNGSCVYCTRDTVCKYKNSQHCRG
uniref:Uncharacterized protein n=1 Tax=Romanomermis culicivorax TaxID=13658 RepID=A0A915IFA5_ROMCU